MLEAKKDFLAGALWVEDEAGGICPLEDSLPMVEVPNLNYEGFVKVLSTYANKTSSVDGLAMAATELIKSVTGMKDVLLSQSFPSNIEQYYDYVRQMVENAVAAGSQNEFVSRELDLLSSLVQGTAVEHHLEPSYFNSFSSIVTKAISKGSNSDEMP
jgi:hypothetical protein